MSRRHALLLLAPPALLAVSAPAEAPRFAPKEGSEVRKTFESATDFLLEDFSAVVDGQDIGAMLGAFEFEGSGTQTVVVEDVYEKLGEGRPERLRRTFDEIGGSFEFHVSMGAESDGDEVTSSSDLEGQTVVFAWDPDEEDFLVEFDGAGDEDLLEDLEEDMDLRVLLPKGEVSEGDTWEVPIADLGSIGWPGGDLSLVPDEADPSMDEEQMEELAEMFKDRFSDLDDLFDGTCTCVLVGTRELDGLSLAEIGVSMEVGASADLSEMIRDLIDELSDQFGEDVPPLSIDAAEITVDFDGEGTLLWDLSASRLHSFRIDGDLDLAFDFSMEMTVEGESHAAEISAEASGTHHMTVEAEG